MATKVTISKRLEAQLRGALFGDLKAGDEERAGLIEDIVGLIDAAHSSKASGSLGAGKPGLSARVFLESLEAGGRSVTKPPTGPIADRTYARLSKCLREMAVTEEQASMLGVWLAGEGQKAAPGDITIDRIIKNLGDWVTRAVANRPTWEKPEW